MAAFSLQDWRCVSAAIHRSVKTAIRPIASAAHLTESNANAHNGRTGKAALFPVASIERIALEVKGCGEAMAFRIFISWSGDDGSYARRLHDRLASRFGRENVVLSVDAVMQSDDFQSSEEAIAFSDVVVIYTPFPPP